MTADLGRSADESRERLRSLERALDGTRSGWSGVSRQGFDDRYIQPLLVAARRWNSVLDEAASEIKDAMSHLE